MFGLQVAWRSPLRNESVVLGTDGHAASFFAENVDLTPARSTIQQDEEPMCPICLATAALVVAGATSTGGLIALAVEKTRSGRTGVKSNDPTSHTGGEHDE
jgi:hypothetical protein